MTEPIAPSVFDYIDELADLISSEKLEREEIVDQDSIAITFCEALFDQVFADIGLNIRGFSQAAKKIAGTRIEQLRASVTDRPAERKFIALYEGFCDMYIDLTSDYGEDRVSLTYETFHTDYLVDVLKAAEEWCGEKGYEALAERINSALESYRNAIETSAWLTKTTKSGSVWRRAT